MSGLVRREDVVRYIRDKVSLGQWMQRSVRGADEASLALCNMIMEDVPSAEAERKWGHWIYDENGMDWNLSAWICSECRCRNDNIPTMIKMGKESRRIAEPRMWQGSRFCPNCGADMRGEKDE